MSTKAQWRVIAPAAGMSILIAVQLNAMNDDSIDLSFLIQRSRNRAMVQDASLVKDMLFRDLFGDNNWSSENKVVIIGKLAQDRNDRDVQWLLSDTDRIALAELYEMVKDRQWLSQRFHANAVLEQDGRQQPLLIHAIKTGKIHAACFLLDQGASIKLTDLTDGDTTLIIAIKADSETMVQRLLERDADPNEYDDQLHITPLSCAAQQGNVAIIDLLAQKKVLLNATSYKTGETALACAVRAKQYRAVEKLLALKANANTRDNDGYTPFDRAREIDDIFMQKMLAPHIETVVPEPIYVRSRKRCDLL